MVYTILTETDSFLLDDEDDARSGRGGMLDRSRLALCVFVFTLLAVNPLGVLVGGPRIASSDEGQAVQGSGRAILSSVDDGRNDTLLFCIYVGNI